MKAKDNVQKTIANSIAILISLILLSITVNAQSFWETVFENSFIQPIALAMVNETQPKPIPVPSIKLHELNTDLASLETESEENLRQESWMFDDEIFKVKNFAVDNENPLELEDWMCNENYFGYSVSDTLQEKEEDLLMENWMVDRKIWN